jgi:outer membrane protein assembly factor BamB
MKIVIFALIINIVYLLNGFSQMSDNWRGPERNGIYPEKDLLKSWPDNGPAIKWVYEGLGGGYSSPVIANNRIYVSGIEEGQGYIYILTLEGELEKKIDYGPEWQGDYPGTRVSPTVAGDLMYIASGNGILSCIDSGTGSVIWKKDLFGDFDGANIYWGYTENLLVEGDRIYCSPGGKVFNVVALNRHDGEIIWSSPGLGTTSAHCSPLMFVHNGLTILTTHMADNILGFDAATGKLLWHFPFANRTNVHPNTPLYKNDGIFYFSGYGQGGVKLNLSPDGQNIEKAWENKTLDNQIGGAVLHDGYIYGSGHNNRFWLCVNWYSGETLWNSREVDKGTVVMADGLLYT